MSAKAPEITNERRLFELFWWVASAMPFNMSGVSLPTTGRHFVFTGKQEVALEEFALPPLDGGQILVRNEYSLMSIGTENIVFNRLFDPGTHWDNWVKYPFFPGYCSVGTVLDSKADHFRPGDRVTVRGHHQSHGVIAEERCCHIPDSLAFEKALWFALAKIAFHGALAADYRLGDTVLIIGAGPIGQMSIRWAKAAGASSIIVVDTATERLGMARAGGATATIGLPIGDAGEAVTKANAGQLPRVVIDSTGHAGVFASALSLAARHGRVVVLGDTGSPAGQRLTSDVITRGLTVVGAHDGLETAQWTGASITKFFLELAASDRFSLDGLNTHFFAPGDCAAAYDLANRERAKTMGIVFDWRQQP